jgi:hypothetical protein
MTVAEVVRYTEGAVWRLQTKAQFDYTLANLIGVSVARILSSDMEYPTIDEVYPALFELKKEEEAQQQLAIETSANRFLQFALQHNARLRQGDNNENDE